LRDKHRLFAFKRGRASGSKGDGYRGKKSVSPSRRIHN
jgi:hypothetical protein